MDTTEVNGASMPCEFCHGSGIDIDGNLCVCQIDESVDEYDDRLDRNEEV